VHRLDGQVNAVDLEPRRRWDAAAERRGGEKLKGVKALVKEKATAHEADKLKTVAAMKVAATASVAKAAANLAVKESVAAEQVAARRAAAAKTAVAEATAAQAEADRTAKEAKAAAEKTKK
jgi:hypothetical protein